MVTKDGRDVLAPHIRRLVDLSIMKIEFPNHFTLKMVLPHYKNNGKSKYKLENYRPVCLLALLSKTLEKVVFKQIVKHMDNEKLWHPMQHVYRKNRSTARVDERY